MTRDGKLVIDDPEIRQRLVKAIDSYTAIYRKAAPRPNSATWDGYGNNKAFLRPERRHDAEHSLSIPTRSRHERPDDYYKNTVRRSNGRSARRRAFPDRRHGLPASVFKDGGHVATAKEFVRFLVAEGWLAHYLDFAGERMLPPMPKLLDAAVLARPERPPPHGRGDAGRVAPTWYDYVAVHGRLAARPRLTGMVWEKAVHRVVAEGISPEQAVDEAIAGSSRS